jgi:RNA polymerase sigma-70 factor (ECF subfamily)
MNDHSLQTLLDQLAQGDSRVVEQFVHTYEPYLRMVVRRQLRGRLRAKFDSLDIVQSVWADLLEGFRDKRWSFIDTNHFRAFLVRAVRNRFVDRLRQNAQVVEHEQPCPAADFETVAASSVPRPSQVAQAEELWQQMLAACPPAHRELLHLKRRGSSLNEIAARTRLHPSSVRRILYDLARRLGGNRCTTVKE